jgi:RHS repeat-associated protein
MRTRSILSATLAVLLTVTLAGTAGSPAEAVAEVGPSEPSRMSPVPGGEVPVRAPAPDPATQAAGTPVPDPAGGALAVTADGATATLDRAGSVIEVRGENRLGRAEPATITVDYSTVRHRYGGDWASRLRLVDLATGEPVPAEHDLAAGRLTATVEAAASGSRYAVTAQEAGGTGDYSATSLAPAGDWQVSLQSGSFSWSYELRTPPVPGELAPPLAMSYNSGGTDGRTASTNNQPSWVGEGWSMWPGFIERSYRPCAEDKDKPRTGDLCWVTENAIMSFDGQSTELVREGTSRRWRPLLDDGTRVEQRFDAGNGDVRGEHWVVTTTDGVQYHFGSRAPARSTWTVPVFGDSPGTGCGGAYATSWCQRAWRWNLDYVVDPRGNTMTYQYATETNRYARNVTDGAATSYVRGGHLERIDYGTRAGDSGAAPARVLFTVADRCRPGASCAQHTGAVWPDVPWDRECTGASCPGKYSPTFWSTKRLSTVTTQVRAGSGYREVDRWTFDQIYPDPGDGTSAGLWLRGITHTGLVGGGADLPAVRFGGTALANRVNSAPDGLPPLNKYRIHTIHNGSGGDINVAYAPVNCSASALPVPATNTRRCFPVRWVPAGESEPRNDWFHTYVVNQVTLDDRVAGGMREVTNYDYLGGGAWHYDDSPLIPAEHRTWSQWRGYEKVRVRHGDPVQEPERPQSQTDYLFFRGMHGDRSASGGTRTVNVTDSTGASLADRGPLAGLLREEISYAGAGGTELTGSIHTPWTRGPTASQGSRQAFQVETVRTETRTALAGGARRTRVDTSYDAEGNPTQVNDLGDLSTAADDRCTRTSYARNPGSWLLNLPSRVATVGVACDATPSYPDDAISDVRSYYDGRALGAAPAAGNLTRTEEAASYAGSTPSYVVTAETTHDAYGRVLDSLDPLRRKTSTRYQPATGLAGSVAVTNPLGHVTTTTLEPAWGEPVSVVDANDRRVDLSYDPLGRLTGVWRPGRSKALDQGPNLRYTYRVRDDGPSWVRTETLTPNGTYLTGYALLDGFLRERQVQQPSPAGGRILSDTNYDSRGLAYLTAGPYYQDDLPGTGLFRPELNQLPAMTLTYFDGAERPTDEIYLKLNEEQWRTSTRYGGDHVSVTPPAGGTATATYTDARDQVTELRQYHGPEPAGGYDATRYRYTTSGELAEVTDAAGNTWQYIYDVRGNRTRAVDPDHGERTMTYDAAGQLLTTTDARGETVATGYDALGRKTALRAGSATGPLLAEWTYDTLSKGQLTSSTRYHDGQPYTRAVTGYDAAGRPQGESIAIPGSEIGTTGTYTYTTTMTYKADGSPSLVRLPALGDLPAETLTHGYDGLGQLTSLKGATAYVNQTVYSELGERSQVELGDPAKGPRVWQTSYYQDGTRRLSGVLTERERAGDMLVDRLTYEYDAAGNPTSIVDEQPGVPADHQCFGYDHLRRMTEAWSQSSACAAAPTTGSVGGPAPYWHSYGYDAVGNRTSHVRHAAGGGADTESSYTYPAAGAARPHAVQSVQTTGAGTASYRYDAAGNTVTRPGPDGAAQELVWDTEGNLASVTAGDRTTGYRYDADGQQLVRRDPGSATVFVGDGELTVDTATGVRRGTRYYGVDGTVAVRTGAGLSWLAADHHGTAQLAIDPVSLQAVPRRFDPFGNPRGPAQTWRGGTRGFVAGTANDATGLTRLGAREYDPRLGRFLSVDPVIDAEDPQQMNAYAYANNSPAGMSDPDGRFYFADHEGRVRAPAAAGQTKKVMQRVQQQIKRFKPMYDKWQQQQRARKQAVSRARQHDWNGADGRRGHVGGGERRSKQFTAVTQALRETGMTKGNVYLAVKALDALSDGTVKSFSVCGEVDAGVLFMSEGVSTCTNFDSVGWTVSTMHETGVEYGADINVSAVLKLNRYMADKAHEPGESLTLGIDIGNGLHAGAELEWLNPSGTREGLLPDSANVKAGWGLGFSLGNLRRTVKATNSGYLGYW